MFDVVAKNGNIAIKSIQIFVVNGTTAQVWTKRGSHIGFENDMNNWTEITGKK